MNHTRYALLLAVGIGLAVGTTAVLVSAGGATTQQEQTAAVTFENQTTDGTNLTVAEATLPRGGFVVVYDTNLTTLGNSSYLEPGNYTDVNVTLSESLNLTEGEERELLAVAHLDTDGDRAFTFLSNGSSVDFPYTDANATFVSDRATVVPLGAPVPGEPAGTPTTPAGEETPAENATATPTPDETPAGEETPTGTPAADETPVSEETPTGTPAADETPAGEETPTGTPAADETPAGEETPTGTPAADETPVSEETPADEGTSTGTPAADEGTPTDGEPMGTPTATAGAETGTPMDEGTPTA